MSYVGKNFNTDGGDRTVIGGVLEFTEGASLKGFPGAANMTPKTTTTGSDIRDDLNALIVKLKNAGIMVPDEWNVSVLSVPTPASMPTSETAANSGHAALSIDGTEITITLDCKVSELADANHGEAWGTHKWLGFGVDTDLAAITGVKFTDDTGAAATLGADDVTEATALGLSAGQFVLYIKAEQAEYLTGDKYFILNADSMAETRFTMKIVEPAAA
nr:hypothetical protein [Clostridia bacterium]